MGYSEVMQHPLERQAFDTPKKQWTSNPALNFVYGLNRNFLFDLGNGTIVHPSRFVLWRTKVSLRQELSRRSILQPPCARGEPISLKVNLPFLYSILESPGTVWRDPAACSLSVPPTRVSALRQ